MYALEECTRQFSLFPCTSVDRETTAQGADRSIACTCMCERVSRAKGEEGVSVCVELQSQEKAARELLSVSSLIADWMSSVCPEIIDSEQDRMEERERGSESSRRGRKRENDERTTERLERENRGRMVNRARERETESQAGARDERTT